MSKLRFITANFTTRNTDMVIKGHNKKFTIPLNPDNFTYDKHGEVYYFKYDAKKEEAGNMQKRYASAFCSYLTERYGGNFVQDIPGEAIVRGSDKEDYHTTLKGIYSHSYRNDERIVTTFSLDEVLKPRANENFTYNNEQRVFASVENSIKRLKSYIALKIEQEYGTDTYNFRQLNYLEEDLKKVEEDLVSIVMLDYLFLNNDRHTENIEFSILQDKYGNYRLSVSPVFDNDRSFGLDKTEEAILRDCENKTHRNAYVDYLSDVKYVIREQDCTNEFAAQMNFANNYHSDIIAEYIKSKCINSQGQVSQSLLQNNGLYQLFSNYKNINIRQEFFDFLSEVSGLPRVMVKNLTPEFEAMYLDKFNKITNSTIKPLHIQELTENFTIRQSLLTQSMDKICTPYSFM